MSVRPGSSPHRILSLLQESPGMKFTTREIADVLEIDRKSVCVFVRDLHKRDLVRSDRTGQRTSVAAHYWTEVQV